MSWPGSEPPSSHFQADEQCAASPSLFREGRASSCRLPQVLPAGRRAVLGPGAWGAGAVPGAPVPRPPACGPVRAPHPPHTHGLVFLLPISGLGQLLCLWQPFSALLCLVILEFNICCSEGGDGDGSDHCTCSLDLAAAREQ